MNKKQLSILLIVLAIVIVGAVAVVLVNQKAGTRDHKLADSEEIRYSTKLGQLTKSEIIELITWPQYELRFDGLPEELKNDENFLVSLITASGYGHPILENLSDEMRSNKDVVLAAVSKFGGRDLQYASDELKANKEVVLAAVKAKYGALKYASKELQDDKEVILIAVKKDSPSLSYASDRLKNDREVVLTAIALQPNSLRYASEELRNDREIAQIVLDRDEWALALRHVSNRLLHDRNLVLQAIQKNIKFLQYTPTDLKEDIGFMREAVKANPQVLEHVLPRMQDSLIAVNELAHVVMPRETLWSISKKYYGTPQLWRKIFDYNNLGTLPNGTSLVHSGNVLLIPGTSYEVGVIIGSLDVIEDVTSNISDVSKYIIGPARGSNYSEKYVPPMMAYKFANGKGDYEIGYCLKSLPSDLYRDWSAIRGDQWYYKYYIERCTFSPDNEHVSFSALEEEKDNNEQNYFYIVRDGILQNKPHLFLDQLVYSPDSSELSYRAYDGNKWYIATDNDLSEGYSYVHTLFYTENGNLYSVIKNIDNSWSLLENNNVIVTKEYIDNIIYLNKANSFAYRFKITDKEGKEVWRVGLPSSIQSKNWGFVDQLFDRNNGEVLFRARDDDGRWYIVSLNNEEEKIIYTAIPGKEIVKYEFYQYNLNTDPIVEEK